MLISADCTPEELKTDNRRNIDAFRRAGERVLLIEDDYEDTMVSVLRLGIAVPEGKQI